jgi:hypothetical protein
VIAPPRHSRARLAIAIVSLGVAAAVALLGFTLGTAVAGFAAFVLILDRAFPMTGNDRVDAQHSFQRLVWERRRAAVARRRHELARLELLSKELHTSANRRHLGVQTIPLDSITGTVEAEKAASFDRAFRPPKWSRGRWERMWMAVSRGASLPPISVFRVDDRHFVIDGHHRVSVSRALGAQSIDANVIELRPLNHARQVNQARAAEGRPAVARREVGDIKRSIDRSHGSQRVCVSACPESASKKCSFDASIHSSVSSPLRARLSGLSRATSTVP